MANSAGEMPFLDHLEELRKRILLSLVAVMAGFGVGWWVTTHFNLIQVVEAPIAPLIPGGKLSVMSATDPFMIVLKFAFLLGLVLASPFIIYQLWLFLAPALTPREKRAIVPSLGIGFLLFAGGAAIGWFFVVTPAVAWLLGFQSGTFNPIITYESYMRLVVHLLVGMGISAELPLVMILLASLGIMSYRVYSHFRRYAVLGAFIGGAILAPTPEVSMMILFTIPLLLLYEVGVAGAYLLERRRARSTARIAAGILFVLLGFPPRAAHAQIPPPKGAVLKGGVSDTTRRGGVTGQGLQRYDTSTAKRLGLPTGPTISFISDDPIMKALLAREGFASTQFTADSVRYNVTDGTIQLSGHAATLRDGGQLEAHGITYDNARCEVQARGDPKMFGKGQSPLIGRTINVNICEGTERGVIGEAFTSMPNGGANWFIRGNMASDSGGKRLYIGGASFTSCDLPDPHYHFVAGEVKWVTNSVIVARPAVLYIRDVPVAWLPFIFQDTRRDRASGILIPRFGFNDIVRTDRNYNRTVSNIGYYWAPNDYIDATGSVDWYANRYTQFTGRLNYRWLDRFINGSLTLSRQIQSDGTASNLLHWDHQQEFDVTTKLSFNVNYQSNSTVQLQNAIDPLASTALISSQLNLTKRYRWGSVSFGGSRSQTLGTGTGNMTLPQLSVQPKAIAFGPHVTWSPSFSVTSITGFNNPLTAVNTLTGTGTDTIAGGFSSQRQTTVNMDTPLQIGGFTWQNHVTYDDRQYVGRTVSRRTIPNPATNGQDSIIVVSGGNYETGLNWDTGINLPLIASGTWKITPSIGVTNVTSGDLLIRSAASDGGWVAQGKKVQVGLSAAPAFFGFLNRSVGPFSVLRYSFEPAIQVQWSPAASVSPEFATAAGISTAVSSLSGGSATIVPATTTITFSFHQSLEGKFRAQPHDTNSDPTHLPKKQIFSISTSPITYDPQQAKLPHHTGWVTSTLTNSFSSALIPGITLSTTHSLWDGQVGSDTAKFSPFLTNANASLQLNGATLKSIAYFLHLAHRDTTHAAPQAAAPGATAPVVVGSAYSAYASGNSMQQRPLARGFSASLTYTLTRYRPNGTTAEPVSTEPTNIDGGSSIFPNTSFFPTTNQPASNQLGIVMGFAPTPFWSVSWNTQYDITHGIFESQNVVLQRDLHDWRASFTFTKNTNGNFALYFTVFLVNLPDIKFDYNQTTLQQVPIQQ